MGKVIRKKGEGSTSYDTHDVGMAIALMTRGHELIAFHPDENSENEETVYHFKFTQEVERDAEAFLKEQLFVNVKKLFLKMYERSALAEEVHNDTAS